MEIKQSRENEILILNVSGRLDPSSVQDMETEVVKFLDSGEQKILFDFSELDYINSAGLRILIMTYQRLKGSGGKVGICSIKDYINEVFELSGFDKILTIYPGKGEAVGDMA